MDIIRRALLVKINCSCSFRSIGQILFIVGLVDRIISHSTILEWVKKMGHYVLHKSKEKATDWILILDESVEFGHSSLLVVLGIRQNDLPKDRPLQAQDMSALYIGKQNSWTGQQISHILQDLERQLGKVIYVVCDNGNNLKKAVSLMDWCKIYDLTHFIALTLKRLYAKNEAYLSFNKAAAYMRRYQCLGKAACLLPPVQGVKARFLNLDKLCLWGQKILFFLEQASPNQKLRPFVQWVKEHQFIIEELNTIFRITKQVSKILKTQGISSHTIIQCQAILDSSNDNPRIKHFTIAMQEYIIQTFDSLNKNYSCDQILCSSDIIESFFGRYKTYLPTNAMIGITDLALTIALFTSPIAEQDLDQAMNSLSSKQLRQYRQQYFGQSIMAERRKLLHNDKIIISKNGEVNIRKSA